MDKHEARHELATNPMYIDLLVDFVADDSTALIRMLRDHFGDSEKNSDPVDDFFESVKSKMDAHIEKMGMVTAPVIDRDDEDYENAKDEELMEAFG